MSGDSDLQKLHVSIGPVQDFVERSRRTRDLWASSFLLSYLAGTAIEAVLDSRAFEAEMVLPRIEDNDLMKAIRGDAGAEAPRHGTIPNRFVLRTDDPEEAFDTARTAFREEWETIAEAVWSAVVEEVAVQVDGRDDKDDTEEIWHRQVEGFWNVYAAVGESPRTLDERKNWRSHVPTVEPGDKCTMMHHWQELSGWIRSRGGSEAQHQDDFWGAVRASNVVHDLDLEEDERLCAPGLIKRLYPRLADDVIGWELDVGSWPSTAYLAAAPWAARAIEEAPDAAASYAGTVGNARETAFAETNTYLKTIEEAIEASDRESLEGFERLSGNFYIDDAVANTDATELDWDDARDDLVDQLQSLYREVGSDSRAEPSRFYCVLLMDGDHMGRMLGRAAHSESDDLTEVVSGALGDFAQTVDDVVDDHGGVAVYAGGDDVLALLPQPRVLGCAAELRTRYLQAFNARSDRMLEERNLEEALGAEPTLSGAVVYAHYKTPLDEVMQEAHAMLDDVAKERTGRDSLAISVLKSSGKQYEWSMPWDDESCSLPLLDGFTPGDPRPTLVDELVDRYCEGEYTSSFIYRLRELFMLLADPPRWRPGTFVDVPGRLDPRALFVSEYVGSTERGVEPEEVEARIERLLDASWWHERGEGTDENRLGFDAPLLVRFLAQERMKVQS